MIPSIKSGIAAMLALNLSIVTSVQASYTADHGKDSRLIVYVGNWQACPTDAQVVAYSHLGELPWGLRCILPLSLGILVSPYTVLH